jgi:hypothetical protein
MSKKIFNKIGNENHLYLETCLLGFVKFILDICGTLFLKICPIFENRTEAVRPDFIRMTCLKVVMVQYDQKVVRFMV